MPREVRLPGLSSRSPSVSSPSRSARRAVRAPLAVRPRTLACLLAGTVALAACGGSDPAGTPPPSAPGTVSVVDGSGQTAIAGAALPAALRVRVTSAQGAPMAGVTVVFTVTSGTATVSPASAVTDAGGVASAQLTLGASAGPVVVTATVAGAAQSSTFTATATAPAPTVIAACSDPIPLMEVGQVVVLGTTASRCLPGGAAGAEYALIASNSADSVATQATILVQSAGIAPTGSAAPSLVATGVSDGAAARLAPRPTPRSIPHSALRAASRQSVRGRMAMARRTLAPLLGLAQTDVGRTVAVGDTVTLNANVGNACADTRPRAGRVMAVGTRAVVVADTGNPAGGLAAADYAAAAATFDTLIVPFTTATFGEPSDVDANGRVVLFFTRFANEFTTPDAGGLSDAGIFLVRDLFPRTAADPDAACAGSNAGEVLYLSVPDPRGTINGTAVPVATITRGLTRTLVHEYQHLVNASRRLYVNTTAEDWEATWLDEGLSHVAEELLFYRVSGLAPRRNLDAAAVRGAAPAAAAFESLQAGNFGRLLEYLAAPNRRSPFADQDTPAARGAAWSFLRYVADHREAPEADLWRRLANGTAVGFANLRAALGSEPAPLLRDWATSLLTDELPGAAAAYQQPSWHLRSLVATGPAPGTYPLASVQLAGATPLSLPIVGGGTAYLRFAVAADAAGGVYWDALPTHASMTLVRTR